MPSGERASIGNEAPFLGLTGQVHGSNEACTWRNVWGHTQIRSYELCTPRTCTGFIKLPVWNPGASVITFLTLCLCSFAHSSGLTHQHRFRTPLLIPWRWLRNVCGVNLVRSRIFRHGGGHMTVTFKIPAGINDQRRRFNVTQEDSVFL